MQLLAAALRTEGKEVVATAEPGGSALGVELRGILKDVLDTDISPMAELFLFLSDRVQHVKEIILPALEEGQVVICDRFTDSTLAYQGFGRGLDLDLLKELNRVATSGLEPDLTIVLDCDAGVGFKRHDMRENGSESCRFHQESLDFHNRVREGYKSIADGEPDRFRLIDASGSIEEVQRAIKSACEEAGI